MSLREDIKMAQLIVSGNLESNIKNFHNYSFIYKTTNENIKGVLEKLKINKNSKILTVSSSMDQVFSFALLKPSMIDCFDISSFSKYFFDLKICAIKRLDYNEYIKYFLKSDCYEDEFSDEIYDKLKSELTVESRIFWDSLYNFFEGFEIYNSFLFSSEYYSLNKVKKLNIYLTEENYNKLKNYLNNIEINFTKMDIINDEVHDNYDYIYLSNIIDYNNNETYREKIESLKCLKENASLLTYLYDFNESKEKFYRQIFKSDSYSFHKLDNQDAVMVYKK